MNYSQRPRKKGRGWLPLVCGLVLAVGGGLLWRQGLDTFFSRHSEPAPSATKQAPAPPVPAPAATSGPETRKARQPIFSRNMDVLAVSFKQAAVYLRPVELQEGQKPVEQLAEILGMTAEKLKADLQTERSFVWLKRNLSAETARKIAEAHLNGVYLVDQLQRYYPLHDHAAHVAGFVKDELGLAGAEFIYDAVLSGDSTLALQYLQLPGILAGDIPASGAAAVLSVDIDLQIILEKRLQRLLQETAAQSACAVLLDAGSGEVMAMAEVPAYNPNTFWKSSGTARESRILSEPVPMAGFNAFVKAAAELSAGNLPPELAAREEEAARVITPRIMKIVKGDLPLPASHESQVWEPGIHLSPPFAWPLDYTQQEDRLAAFSAKLGLAASGNGLADMLLATGPGRQGKGVGCHLDDADWRLPPLSVLAAFAQLINGGKAVPPHLLRGIWRMEDSTFHPTSFQVVDGIGPQASADFVSFVESLLPAGPGDDLIIESIRSVAKQAVTVPGRVRQDEPPQTVEEALRFLTMTLGAGRQGEHQLVLLMVVEGAKVNLSFSSPFRRAAAEIISRGQGLMASHWEKEIKAPKLESDALLFQKWSLAQEAADSPAAMTGNLVDLEMPDLVGMSLRKAMQTLQGYNLKVSVQGSGRVTRQAPAAGVRLKGVTEAKLELQMMDLLKTKQ